MTNEKITCPKCNGLIAIPAEFTGKLECPRCDELVYSRDAETGVTWTTSQSVCQAETPKEELAGTISQPSKSNYVNQHVLLWDKPGFPLTAGLLFIGALGLLGSALVEKTAGGWVFNVVANPLIWLGIWGLVRLIKMDTSA